MNDSVPLPDVAREIARRWERAWNTGDADALAALLAEDADWVTVGGRQLKGRQRIRDVHAQLFAGALKGTTWTPQSVDAQAIADGVALVTCSWVIAGERDATGATKPGRAGVFSWLLVRDRGAWLVRLGQTTNVLPA